MIARENWPSSQWDLRQARSLAEGLFEMAIKSSLGLLLVKAGSANSVVGADPCMTLVQRLLES